MSSVNFTVTQQQFITCYNRTHPSESNGKIKGSIEWFKLKQKHKSIHHRNTNKWPQIFHDAARQLMNEWTCMQLMTSQIEQCGFWVGDKPSIDQNSNAQKLPKIDMNALPSGLQLLIKWIQNIECDNPTIIDLDFKFLKQNFENYIVDDKHYKKLLYSIRRAPCSGIKNYGQTHIESMINEQQLWHGNSSIIHYILSNKSALLPPTNPDIVYKQKQLINKLTNKQLILCMEQCISILNLLLIDTKIINIYEIYEDDWSLCWNIFENIKYTLRRIYDKEEYYIKHSAEHILELYLSFYMKCLKLKPKYNACLFQHSIINISTRDVNKRWKWRMLSMFADDNCYPWNRPTEDKIPKKLLKQLLFRCVSPFQMEDPRFGDWDKRKFLHFNEIILNEECVNKYKQTCILMMNNSIKDLKLCDMTAFVAPIIIVPFLNEVKNEMRELLCDCLCNYFRSKDCINVILMYLYYNINLDLLYPINGFRNSLAVKCYEFVNYMELIDNTAMDTNDRYKDDVGKISIFLLNNHEKEMFERIYFKVFQSLFGIKQICRMIKLYDKPLSIDSIECICKQLVDYDRCVQTYCFKSLYLNYHKQQDLKIIEIICDSIDENKQSNCGDYKILIESIVTHLTK